MLTDNQDNLKSYDEELEGQIDKEFRQILHLPSSIAKKAAFGRMSGLVKQRHIDYVKALEQLLELGSVGESS